MGDPVRKNKRLWSNGDQERTEPVRGFCTALKLPKGKNPRRIFVRLRRICWICRQGTRPVRRGAPPRLNDAAAVFRPPESLPETAYPRPAETRTRRVAVRFVGYTNRPRELSGKRTKNDESGHAIFKSLRQQRAAPSATASRQGESDGYPHRPPRHDALGRYGIGRGRTACLRGRRAAPGKLFSA
jgi:hypothetical protein